MLWLGPIFLFSLAMASYRFLSKVAYRRGLNEHLFGALGPIATCIAGTLSYYAGASFDLANPDIAGMFFGGLMFLPMEALYIGAIYFVIRQCPADAGDLGRAAIEQHARADEQRNRGEAAS